jgi:hypothetical protein
MVLSMPSRLGVGVDPDVMDMWEIRNSEDFAPNLMWGGVYLPGIVDDDDATTKGGGGALVGWAPETTAVAVVGPGGWGICGDLYVLRAGRKVPSVERGVCLSQPGCYCCVVEWTGVGGEDAVVCIGPDGALHAVGLIVTAAAGSSSSSQSGMRVEPRALAACGTGAQGEMAVLYQDCVRVYYCCTAASSPSAVTVMCCTTVATNLAPGVVGACIAACPAATHDLYVIDDRFGVCVLGRRPVDRQVIEETLDGFFGGDNVTAHVNAALADRWARVMGGVLLLREQQQKQQKQQKQQQQKWEAESQQQQKRKKKKT